MRLTLTDELPFVQVVVGYHGDEIEIPHVLLDTGSATTIMAVDQVARLGIVPEPSDRLYTIRGVGGVESVFTRRVGHLRIGHREVSDFEIEVGGMDYGFEIQGILGMDFLLHTGAIINLGRLNLEFYNV